MIQSGESVLEVGCGRGEYLHHLQTQDVSVLGVDHSYKALETGSEIGVPVQSHDLMSDDPLPYGYNVVLCLQVLELFKDPWYDRYREKSDILYPYKHLIPAWVHLHEFHYTDLLEGLRHHGPITFIGGHPSYIIGPQK